MKSKKKKHWLAWIGGTILCLAIPMAFFAKSSWNDFRAKVGRDKTFITELVKDHYSGKNVDERVLDKSRNQLRNVLTDAQKQNGKFLAIDAPDTIPSIADAFNQGEELSYNVPVQFEKGYKTFTFRIRNAQTGEQAIWLTSTDGILPHDDVKKRIKKHLR